MYSGITIPHTKWWLVFKLMALYSMVALIMVGILKLSGHHLMEYSNQYPMYFSPLKDFRFFFWLVVWEAGLIEEAATRGPMWLLIASDFTWTIGRYAIDRLCLLIILTVCTFLWATTGHPAFNWSIFAAGMGWGWLVYKTKSLWPAVVSHMLANLMIYLAIHFALYMNL